MKFFKSVLVFSCVLLMGGGCVGISVNPGAGPTSGVSFGTQKTLEIGSAVTYEDGLLVQLLAINDSRCPADVQCIWAGELSAELAISGGEIGVIGETLNLGTSISPTATRGSYVFSLDDITTTSATISVSLCESCALLE